MGEVTENIHTFALPNESQPYTFKMKYRYDSWKICASRMKRKLVFYSEAQPNLRVANRVQSITYPDGEVVSYKYDRGGMLRNMEGQKGTQTFKYIEKIYYNRYGLKDAQWYGNGTEVKYSYDTLMRLSLLESRGALGVMQHVTYDYDKAGNITGIQNSAPISPNGLGGTYAMTYAYDSLYRLQGSTGGLNGRKNYSYWLDMAYDANGRILRKSQLTRVFTSTSSDTLMNYAHLYNYGTAPVNNRVQSVADTVGGGPAQTFSWDANGNMLSHASSIGVRTHCWDELNRLQGSADKKHNACYLYDAGGDRFYKFSGTPDIMYVNGQWHTYLTFSDPTLYASPYLVATNKGYTKHYYAESERVASKIGGGGLQNLHAVCDELYTDTDNTSTTSTHIRPRPYAELPALDFEAKRDSSKMHLKRLADCVEGEMGEIKENILVVLNQYAAGAQASPHSEDECYWYHPDHLGSASWVSDKAGKGIQHLYYLPWGEELDNQRATDYASRYTFSGKERDMETGYGYFGARYYNSDLSIWLSVDPLANKYPSLSPYTYCADNPVKLVDKDGREIGDFFDWKGNFLGTDGSQDDNIFIVGDKKSQKIIKENHAAQSTTDAKKVNVDVSTNKRVINEILGVNQRTKDNGDCREEATFLMVSGNRQTATGVDVTTMPEEGDYDHILVNIDEAVDVSIHSHLEYVFHEEDGSIRYFEDAFSPSGNDKKFSANLNVITGPLREPEWVAFPNGGGMWDEIRPRGAVFYDKDWSLIGSMEINVLSKLVK